MEEMLPRNATSDTDVEDTNGYSLEYLQPLIVEQLLQFKFWALGERVAENPDGIKLQVLYFKIHGIEFKAYKIPNIPEPTATLQQRRNYILEMHKIANATNGILFKEKPWFYTIRHECRDAKVLIAKPNDILVLYGDWPVNVLIFEEQ